MSNNEHLIDIAVAKLGASPPVERVIELLVREQVITAKRVRRAVVRHEFYRMLADPHSVRTAHDIEQELAARFDISVRSVQAMRSEGRKGQGRDKSKR